MRKATAIALSVFVVSAWTGIAQAGGSTKVPIDPTVKTQNAAERKSQRPIPPQADKKKREPKSTVKQSATSDDIGHGR